eukprot:3880832-Prymnesium_polylepis.1
MQGGGEVQAGPSGTAIPAYGARGGCPLFAAFVARLCPGRRRWVRTRYALSLIHISEPTRRS